MAGDEAEDFRPGDAGYWAHWGRALTERDPALVAAGAPLRWDVIADAAFAERDWLTELDRDVVRTVVDGGLISGRAIVPPTTLERPAEDLVALSRRLGFEVRVLPVASTFAIYDGLTVVLPETDAAGVAGHRAIRRPAVVRPLAALFDLYWAAATTWAEHTKGAIDVLELLARGWSDEQIAAELGVSPRTVSRRVADAMTAAGARSRFELGMRYGQARRGDAPAT